VQKARQEAAADFVQALVETTDTLQGHPWIKSVKIEGQTAIVSGIIQRTSKGRVLKQFEKLKTHLERDFREVKVRGQEFTRTGMLLELEIETLPQFARYLDSKANVSASLSCGQIWRRAEIARQKGEESYRQAEYASAVKTYENVIELYAETSKTARSERAIMPLDN
jgi:hypothetical protein